MIKIFIGVIAVAFIVIVGFMVLDPDLPKNANVGNITESIGAVGNKFTIEGEVYKTGTYTLGDTPTMGDLIEAAGGLTAVADEYCYFPDAELKGGTTYYIASKFDSADVCNNKEIEKVNINSAAASDLTVVNGITASIANSIVSWRIENGMFHTLEDLMDVYGIGTATYRKIRTYVILHE